LHAFALIFLSGFLVEFCEKWAELDGFFFTGDGEMCGKRG
jgi:hypothetical protein